MDTKMRLQMDFNDAKKQAKALEDIASQIEKMNNVSMVDTLNDINNCWKGDNATAFIAKGNGVREEMATTAKNLRKIAETIRGIAKNTYDAEMKNVEIAEHRSFAGSSGGGHAGGGGRSF